MWPNILGITVSVQLPYVTIIDSMWNPEGIQEVQLNTS